MRGTPRELRATHPIIIEELLALAKGGKIEALSMMIDMLKDLHQHGRNSRYLQHLKGSPVHELKSRSRGGHKGGSRVYLFLTADDEAGIVNCEVKDDDTASLEKLKVVLQIIEAYTKGMDVFGDP